jgi:hypothetical protein
MEKRKRDVQHAKDLQDTAGAQLLESPGLAAVGSGAIDPRTFDRVWELCEELRSVV